jgi:hypothetical protein
MNCPPSPYGYQIAVLRAQGRHKRARQLLESLNVLRRAFGGEEYAMPDKLTVPMEGLVSCPAYVPIVETIVRPNDAGGYRVQEAA